MGSRVSWLHPNMPWDNTSLFIVTINSRGELGKAKLIAGADDNESVCQPLWSPDDTLYFISDKNNWWNLYRLNEKGIECVLELEAEFAVPQWSFRECNYDFIDNDSIMAVYRKQGLAYLAMINTNEKNLETFSLPYTDIESLVCDQRTACFLAASPTEFASIIEYDIEQQKIDIIQKSNNISKNIFLLVKASAFLLVKIKMHMLFFIGHRIDISLGLIMKNRH